MSLHQLNSKNNGPVLLLKIISRQWNCFLSSDAADGKNGNGLKFEKKMGLFSSSFDATSSRITKKLLSLALPDKIHLLSSSYFYRNMALKALSIDFSTELTQNSKISVT